jgi:hypothetical protein
MKFGTLINLKEPTCSSSKWAGKLATSTKLGVS